MTVSETRLPGFIARPAKFLASLFRRTASATTSLVPVGPALPGYRTPRRVQRRGWRIFAYVSLFVLSFFYISLFSILPLVLALPALLPVVAMALMAIWVLPVSDKPPSGLVDFLFWGFYITLIVWPNYVAISIPGLPWITTLRLFGIPMAFLLMFHASTSQPFRQQVLDIVRTDPWIVRFVTAFAIVQVLSIPTSLSPFDAINKVFSNQIAWTALFFGAIWIFRKQGSVVRVLSAYCWMIGFLCIIAFIEARMERVIWQDVFPSFMIARDEAVENILKGAYRLTGEYRTVASSTTPLSFAELLALSIPFAFALTVRKLSPLSIFAFLMFDLAVGYAVSEAASRLGYVGMLMAHLGIALYIAYFTRKKNPDGIIGPLMMVLAASGVGFMIFAVTFFGRVNKAVFGGSEHQYSNEGRSDQWALFPGKIIENPITGFGASQGANKLGYVTPSGQLTIDSYPLSIFMDYGLLGTLTYWPMIFAGAFYAFRNIKRLAEPYQTLNFALLVFFCEYIVIRTVLSQEANQPLLFLALAAVCATSYHGLQALREQPTK